MNFSLDYPQISEKVAPMSKQSDIKKFLENLSEKIEEGIDLDLLILLEKIPNYFRKTYTFRPPEAEHLRLLTRTSYEDAEFLCAVMVPKTPMKAIGISLSRINSNIDYFPWKVFYRVAVYENINLNSIRKITGEFDYDWIKGNFPFSDSAKKYEKEYVRWRIWRPLRWLISFFQKGNLEKDTVNQIFFKLDRLENYLDWLIKNPELNKIYLTNL